ncbi:LysM peptidoglycan-binding domain-containing protein [Pseudoxanthomonas winnipegensis]|uniref:LysM peptidoglycan-binding domain-containing protein n=1 Tax=Pseudoxanthomonas winnipegensis TaxID=2480810 RepID=UPI002575F7AF|nr:LysM domain-containing protein [Pseudoxanthomonas winnipegensis]WJI15010.1 LysM peptidoglycan-binding domain-containing protein [Pseudoxanthomonas winnipegensis]
MFKQCRTAVAVAFLTLAAFATAQEFAGNHPDTYVVRKGDTLWDISARFLKKPWLWPEIWQANPQIANPHLIYPGDVISLAYLDRVAQAQVKPGPRQDAPITGVPLSDIEPFLRHLRVVDSIDDLPYVAGLQDDRLRAFGGQDVYAVDLEAPQVGQRYAVVRPTKYYDEPKPSTDLDYRGERTLGEGNLWKEFQAPNDNDDFLGYELEQMAIGTVTAVDPEGNATTLHLEGNGREVRAGDRLIPVEAQPFDLQFFPHPPRTPLVDGKVRIMSISDTLSYGGAHDVVALSGGSREGLDNGTVLSVWRPGSYKLDPFKGSTSRIAETKKPGQGRNKLPDQYTAHVMIFKTYEKVSYGLIMEGSAPSRVGYFLRDPDAGMPNTATASVD